MIEWHNEQMGKKATTYLIIVAGVVNVLMAAYFIFTIYLEPAVFWGGQEAYAVTLGLVPRIVIASILAELVAQLLDTEIYQRFWERFPNAPQFTRVLASNGIAAPIDSIIFVSIAFAGTMPIQALISLMIGQAVFKFALAVISMPMIYLIPQNPEYMPKSG